VTSSKSLSGAEVPSRLKHEPASKLDLKHSRESRAKVVAEAAGSMVAGPLD
jgi:hypothetical protein